MIRLWTRYRDKKMPNRGGSLRLTYLSLQSTSQGQAAHAHVNEIVNGLRRRGWEVTLYQPAYEGEPSKVGRLAHMLLIQVRALTGPRPDALYVRWHFASLLASWVAHHRRIAVVQEVNGSYSDVYVAWPGARRFRMIVRRAMAWQLRHADAIVTVTEDLARALAIESPDTPIDVITNGADTTIFSPERKSEVSTGLPSNYAVFFGALSPWQGLSTMLLATESTAWPYDLSLVVVGDGVERTLVEEFTKTHERVLYLGVLPYLSVGTVVAASRCSIIAKEGDFEATGLMPLKLFESMASGVPVVVTDYPGIADIVREHRAGVVVPPRDPEALARGVAKVTVEFNDFGLRARDWVVAGQSWDARAQETDAVLRRTVG